MTFSNPSVSSRRDFARLAGLSLVLSLGGARLAAAATPVPADRKLVFIILRGALDGLAAAAPIGAPEYSGLRGALSLAGRPGLHPIGEGMVLHPALAESARLWNAGELALLHAAATPCRSRSHFDGQDVLESGADRVYGAKDGWLNRALARASVEQPDIARPALAVGQNVPLVLRGAAKAGSWAPSRARAHGDDILDRLMALYEGDDLLFDALTQAMGTQEIAATAEADLRADGLAGARGGAGARIAGPGAAYQQSAKAGAALLKAPNGPGLIVLSFDGWDSHFNQGAEAGPLALRLAGLDAAFATLRSELGPLWQKTLVIAASEFGRTARANGSGGTDHGTGGLAFLAGGGVKGGRFLGDWPGLARLHEGRDLAPQNDLRRLFKGALAAHWGLSEPGLAADIFPDSGNVKGFSDLLRA